MCSLFRATSSPRLVGQSPSAMARADRRSRSPKKVQSKGEAPPSRAELFDAIRTASRPVLEKCMLESRLSARSLTRLFPSKTVEEEPLICAELWGRPLGLHSSLFGSYLTSSNKIALGRCDRTWMQTVAWPSMWKELSCREWKTHATTFLALVSHPRFGQTSTLALPKMTLSQGTFHKLKAKLPRLVSLDLTQVRGLNETRFASMVDNFASLHAS